MIDTRLRHVVSKSAKFNPIHLNAQTAKLYKTRKYWTLKTYIMLLNLLLLATLVWTDPITLDDKDPINKEIKQVVVLMLENRSFDSIYGSLPLLGINKDVNGLTSAEGNYLKNGSFVKVHKTIDTISDFDPGHSVEDVTEQLYGKVLDQSDL
jgi:phospholipase C